MFSCLILVLSTMHLKVLILDKRDWSKG